ncbi:hypothetical protein [Bifidobacterium coryneforme]|uniref:hypothetical protein n=1 Tax=Bifidobacterium coryneforme TaxID=1687 RepID=UPI0023F0D14F|nr:hypothetical protein [Bifidobacterium coryneforme]
MTDTEPTKETGEWRRPKSAPCSMVQTPLVDYMWGVDDTRSTARDRQLHAAARALYGVCPLKDKCLAPRCRAAHEERRHHGRPERH